MFCELEFYKAAVGKITLPARNEPAILSGYEYLTAELKQLCPPLQQDYC
jgi:hypothetical protein